MMTYGILKQKIFSLLDLDGNDIMAEGSVMSLVTSALPYTIDAVSRKVALHLKNIVREETLHFEKGAVGIQATLPEMAFGVREIVRNDRAYHAECFTLIGRNIILFEHGEGDYRVFYYAFPEVFTEQTTDETPLPFDDLIADIVAYGVAGELSHTVYPADMTRYMRLMTAFDERISSAMQRMGEISLKNSFFGKRRGVR